MKLLSFDEIQREITRVSNELDGVAYTVSSSKKTITKYVGMLLDFDQLFCEVQRRIDNLCMSLFGGELINEGGARRYVTKIKELQKRAECMRKSNRNLITISAQFEAAARKMRVPDWVSVAYAMCDYTTARGYWTWAIRPESRITAPEYDIFYRIDFGNLKHLVESFPYEPQWSDTMSVGEVRNKLPETFPWLHLPTPMPAYKAYKGGCIPITMDATLWIDFQKEVDKYSAQSLKCSTYVVRSNVYDSSPPSGFERVYDDDPHSSPVSPARAALRAAKIVICKDPALSARWGSKIQMYAPGRY